MFNIIRRVTDTPQHVSINERRLVDIVQRYMDQGDHVPPWLMKIALGTCIEDHSGIDVVATSDVGPLFIQVKSSPIGRLQFEEKYRQLERKRPRLPIVEVVIVNDKLTDEEILHDCLGKLHALRTAVQRHGSSFIPCRGKASA